MHKQNVTMEDVAAAAGVSRASVSRVFLGQKKVSQATRDKVLRVAHDLGYVPNIMAGSLSSSRTDTIGLLLRDASNPAYGLLFTELQRAAQLENLSLISMTISIDKKDEKQIASLEHLLGLRVAGLIVATGGVPSEKLLPFHEQLPIIRAGRPEVSNRIHAISYDEEHAGITLSQHIIDLGHRNVAVLQTRQNTSFPEWTRATAMINELKKYSVNVTVVDVDHPNDGHDELLAAIQHERVTAVMCPSDMRQLGVLRWLHAAGYSVPDDVSVTGCDGALPGSDVMGLTTYRIPIEELAQQAITEISRLIAKPAAEIVNRKIPGGLVIGSTTGAPKT